MLRPWGTAIRLGLQVDRQWTKRNAESARAQAQTLTGSSAAPAGQQSRPGTSPSSAAAAGSSAIATPVPAAASPPGRGDSDDAFQTVAGRRRKLKAQRGTEAAGEQEQATQPPAAAVGRGRGADLQIHWHVSSSASPLDFSGELAGPRQGGPYAQLLLLAVQVTPFLADTSCRRQPSAQLLRWHAGGRPLVYRGRSH